MLLSELHNSSTDKRSEFVQTPGPEPPGIRLELHTAPGQEQSLSLTQLLQSVDQVPSWGGDVQVLWAVPRLTPLTFWNEQVTGAGSSKPKKQQPVGALVLQCGGQSPTVHVP